MTTYHLRCNSYRPFVDGTYDSYEETLRTNSIDTAIEWLQNIENSSRYEHYHICMYEVDGLNSIMSIQYEVDHTNMTVIVDKNISNIDIFSIFSKQFKIA